MATTKGPSSKKNIFIIVVITAIAAIAIAALIISILNSNKNTRNDTGYTVNNAINTTMRNDAAILTTALVNYMTNTSGRLPTINGDSQITNGTGSSAVDHFYKNYLEYFVDYHNKPYTIQFVNSADISKIIGGVNYLNVFYSSDCDDSGNLVSSSSSRHYAIVFTNPEATEYYCVGY